MFSGDGLIPRLKDLYRRMDDAYRAIARDVGFSCEGCDGVRCCTVDVTLHTFVEMFYLRRGFNSLNPSRQLEILGRSGEIVKAKEEDSLGPCYRNAVCSLNFDGLCSLYDHRPMICRLAGIPHFMIRPDGKTVESVGCSRYMTEVLPKHPELKLDRSEFYRSMARIEIEVVRARGKRTRSRTVAETVGREDPEQQLP
ncbi:MAG: hypothetical protein RDU20_22640 [Desulfomonilaceae bacterium]|nr:hypothetical protein [Desulfomonilaceae bacterium]